MKKRNLDDVLKEFEEKANNAVSSNRQLWEEDNEYDEMYNVDIHIWRKPGMGNSIQTISGNKISIMTATSSYLETLIREEVFTFDELDEMIKLVKQTIRKENENE